MSPRIEPELVALRKQAEESAQSRKERVTTCHLLAAIAARPSVAADLLNERRLNDETLLKAARAATDDQNDAVRSALQRAREIAARMGGVEAGGLHLLIALVSDRHTAAHRALDQHGVDLGRLRAAAMSAGLGFVGRRRTAPRRAVVEEEPKARASARVPSGTTIPMFPPASEKKPARQGTATLVRDPHMPSEPPPPAPEPASAERRAAPKRRARPAEGERFALDPQKFPTLCGLGRNLTLAAARHELDPVVGRSVEIDQALDVLAKRHGNNPCLVGAAGVGKTSVARGIAQRIADADSVLSLDDRIIVEIPLSELIAGTGVRGALASRLGSLRKEVAASGNRVVLFFDELHQLFAGDAAEEIGAELKLALAKGELPCIGATTREDYAKIIERDAALARRFSVVEIDEPSREDAYLVLEALSEKLSLHHHVGYDPAALALTIGWSVRYLPGRALPDKAVSIVDLAGARTRRRGGELVTPEAVAEVVAELADMPVERLLETDADRFLRMEEILAERVVGHAEAIRRIARILRRNAAGLGSKRPIGTFLLLGPTGVGKTETAKAVAEVLFHSESAMTRLDLSEFSEPHSIARLIGAPPGYVGHDAGGFLTEAVRRRPYQVVLLDEIEKAHPEVLVSFLAVFDEGRLTDGRGRTVDFTNTVILMTSNLGASEAGSAPRRKVGFGAESGPDTNEVEKRVTAAARAALAPELYNRIDEVLVMSPLGRSEVREIARRLLEGVSRTLQSQRGVRLEVEDAAIDLLLDAGGFDPTLGARPMKRTIARLVEAPLAEQILQGKLGSGDVAFLTVDGGELGIDVLSSAAE
ncbi:MAG: ATP-dependent Clp protease ATP-binding subunit [Myxococcales bacterium]|nr:ATP-dependent Clp protease ATP-binding subunit [Myxococcales bacterium]